MGVGSSRNRCFRQVGTWFHRIPGCLGTFRIITFENLEKWYLSSCSCYKSPSRTWKWKHGYTQHHQMLELSAQVIQYLIEYGKPWKSSHKYDNIFRYIYTILFPTLVWIVVWLMLHIISLHQEADACHGEACFDDESEGQHMRPLDARTGVFRGFQEIRHNDASKKQLGRDLKWYFPRNGNKTESPQSCFE